MSKESSNSGGLSLAAVVFVVFLILKLAEIGVVANWSWWWVTCPLWGSLVIAVPLVVMYFIGIHQVKSRIAQRKAEPPTVRKKSRFQQRLAEVQRQQKEARDNKL